MEDHLKKDLRAVSHKRDYFIIIFGIWDVIILFSFLNLLLYKMVVKIMMQEPLKLDNSQLYSI